MPLSMDAFVEKSKPTVPMCPVAKILAALSPKDRDVLVTALGNKNITHAAISAVLTDNGHTMRQDSIGRHRRGACGCAR